MLMRCGISHSLDGQTIIFACNPRKDAPEGTSWHKIELLINRWVAECAEAYLLSRDAVARWHVHGHEIHVTLDPVMGANILPSQRQGFGTAVAMLPTLLSLHLAGLQ